MSDLVKIVTLCQIETIDDGKKVIIKANSLIELPRDDLSNWPSSAYREFVPPSDTHKGDVDLVANEGISVGPLDPSPKNIDKLPAGSPKVAQDKRDEINAKATEAKEIEAKEIEAKEIEAKEIEAKATEAKATEAKEIEAKEIEAKAIANKAIRDDEL